MRYRGVYFKNSATPVVREVERAARDMGASELELQMLLAYLSIESNGSPRMTFANPELEKYRNNPKARPVCGRSCYKYRGVFQILVNSAIERFYSKKYGYDTTKFGDPYHQTQVILKDIRSRINPRVKKIAANEEDALMLLYLTHNQGAAGSKDIYKLSRSPRWANVPFRQIPSNKFTNPKTGTIYPHKNFSSRRYKKYGMKSADDLTPAIFVDMWRKKVVGQMKGISLKKGGASGLSKKVFLGGDSNTTDKRKFWKAFIAKNFGLGTQVRDVSKNGLATWHTLERLKEADGAAGIVIGSLGGNDVSKKEMGKLSSKAIQKRLKPGGQHYEKYVAPLFKRLKQLQNKGSRVVVYGLPFGRGHGDKCSNNTPLARKTMDNLLAFTANEYGIDYKSVFEQTKEIKGEKCGVHYGGKDNKAAYSEILRSKDPINSPVSDEEEKYAKSIIGGKKIKISRNRWFKKYKYINKAGITFDNLYSMFQNTFGADWIKLMLPVHGKDYIFGPEHFAAFKKLAKENQDAKLLSLVNRKSPVKDDPVVAKAEEKAEDKIYAQGATKVKPKVAKKKPIKIKPKPVKPVTFEQAIFASKKNDIIFLKLKKDVKKYGFTIFKKGKTYKAKILDSSNVNIEHEKIMLRGDNETMSKNDLIKNIKEQGGEPCDILDCGASRIKRKGKEKSFSDFLKHPSFKNEKDGLTENKIKRKIRIILNC